MMELCQYGPVSDIASALVSRGRRLIEDQIAYIIKETLHALIYLQLQLVCHRDVKGSNILLTEDCHVKLVDYGISCQVGTESCCVLSYFVGPRTSYDTIVKLNVHCNLIG